MTPEQLALFYARPSEAVLADPSAASAHEALLDALERGVLRAAQRDAQGAWQPVAWVKQAILLGFRRTSIERIAAAPAPFFDKSAYPQIGRAHV